MFRVRLTQQKYPVCFSSTKQDLDHFTVKGLVSLAVKQFYILTATACSLCTRTGYCYYYLTLDPQP